MDDNQRKTNRFNLDLQNKTRKNKSDYYEITEKDFYPPEDKRAFHSGIRNISGGDNFADYFNWFYDMYEDDVFNN